MAAPGQCRSLKAPKQGEGWVFLDWKEPIDGGQVAAYKVQRRESRCIGTGEWSDVATAMGSEITLNGQTRSVEFEFRVIAMNKAGEGEGQQQRHGGAVSAGSGSVQWWSMRQKPKVYL